MRYALYPLPAFFQVALGPDHNEKLNQIVGRLRVFESYAVIERSLNLLNGNQTKICSENSAAKV